MQLFPCPFCGDRDEREFHFAAEAGKSRPDTTGAVSDAEWATYLYAQRNDKGPVREVWVHLTCAELFVLERDSVTMAVLRATPLRQDPA
ncbi:sarcosine oxidase subunit delta [Aestuariivita sp.]|jgi:heterotetrameric sarcosine oxidase delta subunit|uniref:sarcosine oxidase subunit delta n=1 Tax=Aestuariivita sp. TaxID=1872407 RepID=UPI0021702BFA|nr:sarcosine oxidase subunit delta [Aestuariivita sp.]MCE8009411.1 sarcosine oxidase subunit delta [Aestuariivita sp.]